MIDWNSLFAALNSLQVVGTRDEVQRHPAMRAVFLRQVSSTLSTFAEQLLNAAEVEDEKARNWISKASVGEWNRYGIDEQDGGGGETGVEAGSGGDALP